ncbi:tRNA (5-methylaminomethyl-2-thiouridine)(34)-methyltransferase MnmD [Aquimarina addita]|uniref:tRNA (5-methylaminomethyl-2-thiouridine)(34)-methyltransferase MnmD n=1 Tax=Aquimarina addita TaxID=870485 RepID=A0ABP6UW76_9FLAO
MQEKLQREIITTSDGSTTIHFPALNEQYHSKHGAVNEANHVFIRSGLEHILNSKNFSKISILEIGFGTGLNAFVTYLKGQEMIQNIDYVGVEAYPVPSEEVAQLNYGNILNEGVCKQVFDTLHKVVWEQPVEVSPSFLLTKRKQFFKDIEDRDRFDLIYFDAFGARVQPDLWTVAIFQKMYDALKNYGVLVTYSAKGSVRRAMQEVGFTVERLPGPPGKREMLRATKGVLNL